MNITFGDEKPIFIQIAESIQDGILSGAFPEETQIPSITEFSVNFKINPATALKGINMLVDDKLVYKKRGIGMFVAEGAVERLKTKRKEQFYDNYVSLLISEAKRLEISKEEIKKMLERGFDQNGNHS